MNTRDGILLGVATLCALGVGYVNMHTDELLVVLPLIALCTFCLGAAQPRRAWRWALIVGLAVPVSQIVGSLMGLTKPYPFLLSDVPVTTLALLPAVAGAYLGAALGRAAGRSRPAVPDRSGS